MKLYYLNKGTHEYPRMKHSLSYPDEAYKQGDTIYYDSDRKTLQVFGSEEEALNALEEFTSTYWELSDHGINYLLVTEFGIEVNEFDIEKAIEEEEATNKADFLEKIKANPNDYWDYCDTEQSGYYIGCSIGTYTAWVKIEEHENGKVITSYIEQEFTNNSQWNAYEQAEEWSNAKYDEIEEQEESTSMYDVEDITKVYVIDWGVSF